MVCLIVLLLFFFFVSLFLTFVCILYMAGWCSIWNLLMSVHSWKIVESGGFYLGSRTHIHFLSITFLSYMSESVKTYPIFLSVTKTSVFRLMMI